MTEAVVAICEGNFVSEDVVASEVRQKMWGGVVGIIFPILSRNRFSAILKGLVKGVDEVVLQLSYPNDEVGNPLISVDKLYELGVTTFNKEYTAQEFYDLVGKVEHPFTGMDYIKIYQEICGKNAKIVLSNDPCNILKYTKKVICCDIHSRHRTKKVLEKMGAEVVCSLNDFLNKPSTEHGFNEDFGLYGSNKSTVGVLKLFPRGGKDFVQKLQAEMQKRTGKKLECMVYGDGAFKDPVGGIWELADPVVSPAFTSGLTGTPNEINLKYVADNQLLNVSKEEFDEIMREI